MSIPMTTTMAPARPVGWLARWGRELAVLAGGIPMCALAFSVVFTGVVGGAVLTMVWIGLPILSVTALVAKGLADAERAQMAWAWGSIPPHVYREGTWFDRLRDPQSWRDMVHAILGCWVQLATSLVGLIWTVVAAGCATAVLWEWSLPRGGDDVHGPWELIAGEPSRTGDLLLTTAAGLAMLLVAPAVTHAMFGLRYVVARALLTNPSAILRVEAAEAQRARRDAVRAESHTLSMIERSIHDGPQQRLVRLQMDLESARRRLQDDPAAAGDYLDQALGQSREVLQELRAVARGIAPPVLRDRGLVAAVTAAAARNPVDTVVDSDLEPQARWDEDVEAAAYFVVAESLTNVAKHSGATEASVTLVRHGGHLGLRVEDDGQGGAHVGKGHGLAGLEARLASLGGRLRVDSPPGGPTVVTASIPLA
ncbi:MAG: sensor domain-containing protein [Nocardioidaceae bacterium]